MSKSTSDSGSDDDSMVITDLLSYRLHRVANAFERSAAIAFRREFDVSLGEWRALALLASGAANTLNRIARRANLDRGQMSRVVTKLVARGWVARSTGPGNSSPMSLTPEGRRVYEGLIAVGRRRNTAFLGALTAREIEYLDRSLNKLFALAIDMEHAERAVAAPSSMGPTKTPADPTMTD